MAMAGRLLEFKNSVIRSFGTVPGYIILAAGGVVAVSILWLLLKSLLKLAIVLAAGTLLVFAVLKIVKVLKPNH